MSQTRPAQASLSHEERTATEPRDEALHEVILERVTSINGGIRKLGFTSKGRESINFMPGQWLDVYVPGVEKAGGFTITSPPQQTAPPSTDDRVPYLELAVQKSDDNPVAAWLWQPVADIEGREVKVRVGGSFIWPPPGVNMNSIRRAIFIAGGVGINPLISMLTHIHEQHLPIEYRLLYSTKVPSRDTTPAQVLFLPELLDLFRKPRELTSKNRLELFLTGTLDSTQLNQQNDEPIHPLMSLTLPKLEADTEVPVVAWTHRIDEIALTSAVGTQEEALSSVFYVCGPPEMTDSIVDFLKKQPNVSPERVLCEKWW